MIEVVYKEEKQEAKNGEDLFQLPRNIRQIGLSGGGFRIYLEDYVYTFLGRIAGVGTGEEKCCVAVLTGETKWNNGITYLFVRGALMVEDMEAAADHIDFSEKIWSRIQEDQTKYFPGQEIIGWFFSRPQMYLNGDELLTKVHLRYFGGEKVLMLMEPVEKEDAFFCYENGFLVRQRGYYIYYEKNPLMQEYMIEKNKDLIPEITEKVEDEAVVSFRKIIRNKKTKKAEKAEETLPEEVEHTSVFSYAATACLVLAVLAVGSGFYRNYQKMMEPMADATVTVISENAQNTEKSEMDETNTDQENEEEKTGSTVLENTITDMENNGNVEETEVRSQNVEKADDEENTVTSVTNYAAGDFGENASEKISDNAMENTSDNIADDGTENTTENSVKNTVGNTVEDTIENSAESTADNTMGIETENAADNTSENKVYFQEADERKTGKNTVQSETELKNNSSAQETSGGAYETYIIKPGDTLYQISIAHYGNMEAISEICRLNNLKENQVIYPGQMIVLP